MCRYALILLLRGVVAGAGFAAASAAAMVSTYPAAPIGPIVQLIDSQEADDHTDISVQFRCSVRYVTNLPANHGTSTRITLRLGTDCGARTGPTPPELPLVGGGQLVTGARVDSLVSGEITLELTWSRPLDFVMAPTASGLGLRVRLLATNHRAAYGFVLEPESPAGYSVNLDSSQTPIAPDTVQSVARSLQTQAYVSQTDIEDEHWYRLRVGPFATRQEAERVLSIAMVTYPRAWIAVNDEQTDLSMVEHAGVQTMKVGASSDAPLPEAERARIFTDARAALEKHQYPEAVDELTRLLRQPEFPARAECQELLGLVRERAGQLAQAKAEYEEYLQRYPDGAAAARVRRRLRTLAAASLVSPSNIEFGASAPNTWTMAGSTAISYQYGRDETTAAGTTTTTNSLDSALIYGDLLLRGRGERYDFTARVDAGYTHNSSTTVGGSQDRTTAAYAELTDRIVGFTARVGRQSLSSQGIAGIFDGLFIGYQASPRWSISGAAGLPAYTSYSSVSSRQRFATLSAEFDPFQHAWVFDTYVLDETNEGLTERRAMGFQTRYSVPGRTAVLLVDYDVAFQKLNSITLLGNARVGTNWVLGFDADHRRSPLLELGNALIGQTATDLAALEQQSVPPLSSGQIRQLALDRTSTSNTVVISASRPLGERWQFMLDLSTLQLSGTPASGGVAATRSTGLDKNISVQLSGSSLLQAGDLHIFSAQFDDSPTTRSTALSWDARFVIRGAWRLGPRLSVEQLDDPTAGGKQMLYFPQLRGDWTNLKSVLEFTAGYQLQSQQAVLQQQSLSGQAQAGAADQRSLYVTAAYRVRF